MSIDVGLYVTSEYGGSLIGSAVGVNNEISIVAQAGTLEKVAACKFITATCVPVGSADYVAYQVQNFSNISVTVSTGTAADFIQSERVSRIVPANGIGEFKTEKGANVFIVPFFPYPTGLRARKHYFQGKSWGADGVHLKWDSLSGVKAYRVYKYIVLQKDHGEWYVHQRWISDTSRTEFLDSDYKLESFTGYSADTIYTVSALPYANYPGDRSWGVTFTSLDNSNEEWTGASVRIPAHWPW